MQKEIDLNELMEDCVKLSQKRVREIMSKDVLTIKEDSNFLEFATNIELYNYMAFPVVNEKDELVGIISQTDLLKLILFHGACGARMLKTESFFGIPSVQALMSPNPIVLSPDDTLGEATLLMFEHGIQSIPVTERKKVVGIVGKQDIISQVLNLMGL